MDLDSDAAVRAGHPLPARRETGSGPGPDAGLALVTRSEHDDAVRTRRELLARHGVGTGPDPEFDDIARRVTRRTGLRYGFVNGVLEGQNFIGLANPPEDSGLPILGRYMDLRDGWCPHVVQRGLGLPLPNINASRLYAGNSLTNRYNIQAYFGEPLIYHDADLGAVTLGTVCGIDPDPYDDDPRRANRVLEILEEEAAAAVAAIQARSPGTPAVTPPLHEERDPHSVRLWR